MKLFMDHLFLCSHIGCCDSSLVRPLLLTVGVGDVLDADEESEEDDEDVSKKLSRLWCGDDDVGDDDGKSVDTDVLDTEGEEEDMRDDAADEVDEDGGEGPIAFTIADSPSASTGEAPSPNKK